MARQRKFEYFLSFMSTFCPSILMANRDRRREKERERKLTYLQNITRECVKKEEILHGMHEKV